MSTFTTIAELQQRPIIAVGGTSPTADQLGSPSPLPPPAASLVTGILLRCRVGTGDPRMKTAKSDASREALLHVWHRGRVFSVDPRTRALVSELPKSMLEECRAELAGHVLRHPYLLG
jgi:hypothetical protein